MGRKTDQRAIAKIEALYARLPRVACRGLCSMACGPIPMTTLEAARMRKADPGRRLPMIREDVSCIYLTPARRCGVYQVRPLICRVWGVVKRMSCMHGCTPDRWLSDYEFLDIAKAIERVGGELVVSTIEGPTHHPSDTFLDIDPTRNGLPVETVERLAELTLGLRALHGGRIVGVVPSKSGGPEFTDIDEVARQRRAPRGGSDA